MKHACFLLIALSFSSTCYGDIVGNVNFEELFIAAFNPGTGSGISIGSDGIAIGATTGSQTVNIDLNTDAQDDIAVSMSYELYQTGDSRIGFRSNSAGTQLTLFSDSNVGTDFDYGFLSISWTINVLHSSSDYQLGSVPTMTTASMNGSTELYEFGILDTEGNLSALQISNYDADLYTGGDDIFSGATNSLGDANEVLLPEFIGAINGVTYDAEATITGDLGANPTAIADASDAISASSPTLQLFYGGFDVGTDTTVGSPTGSIGYSGTVTLVSVPDVKKPGILLGLVFVLCVHGRERKHLPLG